MLNVRNFTRHREQLEQTFILKAESDLEGLISRNVQCELTLTGSQDEKFRSVLKGQVSADMCAPCQVCNQDVKWQHDFEFEVYPLAEDMLEDLDDDLDVVLCEQDMLNIEQMLIHELILSLPTVLSHESTTGDDCSQQMSMRAGEPIPKKASPFEILNQLKSEDFKD